MTGKRPLRNLFSTLAVCLAVALGFAPAGKAKNAAQSILTRPAQSGAKAAPRTTVLPLVDLVGYRDILAKHRGHPLLVTFWATWCEPCQTEFPMINDLARKYAPKGLAVVGINFDEEADLNVERDFLTKMKPAFRSYRKQRGNEDEFIHGVAPGWRGAIPATALYGRGGRLEAFTVGQESPRGLEKSIEHLLATPAD